MISRLYHYHPVLLPTEIFQNVSRNLWENKNCYQVGGGGGGCGGGGDGGVGGPRVTELPPRWWTLTLTVSEL